MKKILLFAAILSLFALIHADDLSLKIKNEFKTRRISKGKVSNPDPVYLMNAKIEYKGVYFKAFMVDNLTNISKSEDIDRYDPERFEYTLGHAFSLDELGLPLKVDYGWQYTSLQGNKMKKDDSRNEAFVKLTANMFLKPGLKFQYDVDNDYFYINPFISYDWKITDKMKLKNELNLYWFNSKYNDVNFKFNDGAFTCIYYKGFLEMKYNDHLSFGPLL